MGGHCGAAAPSVAALHRAPRWAGVAAPEARWHERRKPFAARRKSRAFKEQFMLMTILLVVLVLSLVGGGIGHSRYGYAGWSPAGIVLVVLAILFFTGQFHLSA
jgi:hypothetical protein